MRSQPTALLCLIAALLAVTADSASAQKMMGRGPSSDIGCRGPTGPSGGGNGPHGGGFRGPGWGAVVPGIIMGLPQGYPSNGVVVDDGPVNNGPRRSQQSNRRGPSGAPPVNERRLVPDEVVIEIPSSVSAQQIDALQRRYQLTRIESQTFQLSGTTLYRWRDSRPPLGNHRGARARRRSAWWHRRSRTTCSRCSRARPTAKSVVQPKAKAIPRNMSSPSCICRRRMHSPKATMCWSQ